MSSTIGRVVAFALPLLMLPIAAHAGPKVGSVTNSNDAVVSHNGQVVPATPNMPLFQGDKVMTLSNGSANVALGGHSVHLGESSMVPMDNSHSVLSLGPNFKGGDFKHEAFEQLAKLDHEFHDFGDHGNHFGRCHMNHGHDDGDDDEDDNNNGNGKGHDGDHHIDHGHGHNPHCPVSP